MSHKDLTALSMSGGPSTQKIDPLRLFIIGLDGEGATESERIDWLKGHFPKLASKIDALRDPRACLPVTEDAIRAFRPKHAGAVKYENLGMKFPDGCGRWSGLALLAVNGGRQRTKTMRATNERRALDNAPALEIQIEGKRYESDMDRREGKAIENASIVQQTPMQRAWLAYELTEGGMQLADAAPLVNVSSEQAVKNLLALTAGSEKVQAAVDLGADQGGITQTAALEIVKRGDHDAQDAELAKRLAAAAGKTGRERSHAIRGEARGPKPVKAALAAKVAATLTADAGDARYDEWSAILLWATTGSDEAYDDLPDDFRAAVIEAGKKPERVVKPKEPKADKPKRGKKHAEQPANDAEKVAA